MTYVSKAYDSSAPDPHQVEHFLRNMDAGVHCNEFRTKWAEFFEDTEFEKLEGVQIIKKWLLSVVPDKVHICDLGYIYSTEDVMTQNDTIIPMDHDYDNGGTSSSSHKCAPPANNFENQTKLKQFSSRNGAKLLDGADKFRKNQNQNHGLQLPAEPKMAPPVPPPMPNGIPLPLFSSGDKKSSSSSSSSMSRGAPDEEEGSNNIREKNNNAKESKANTRWYEHRKKSTSDGGYNKSKENNIRGGRVTYYHVPTWKKHKRKHEQETMSPRDGYVGGGPLPPPPLPPPRPPVKAKSAYAAFKNPPLSVFTSPLPFAFKSPSVSFKIPPATLKSAPPAAFKNPPPNMMKQNVDTPSVLPVPPSSSGRKDFPPPPSVPAPRYEARVEARQAQHDETPSKNLKLVNESPSTMEPDGHYENEMDTTTMDAHHDDGHRTTDEKEIKSIDADADDEHHHTRLTTDDAYEMDTTPMDANQYDGCRTTDMYWPAASWYDYHGCKDYSNNSYDKILKTREREDPPVQEASQSARDDACHSTTSDEEEFHGIIGLKPNSDNHLSTTTKSPSKNEEKNKSTSSGTEQASGSEEKPRKKGLMETLAMDKKMKAREGIEQEQAEQREEEEKIGETLGGDEMMVNGEKSFDDGVAGIIAAWRNMQKGDSRVQEASSMWMGDNEWMDWGFQNARGSKDNGKKDDDDETNSEAKNENRTDDGDFSYIDTWKTKFNKKAYAKDTSDEVWDPNKWPAWSKNMEELLWEQVMMNGATHHDWAAEWTYPTESAYKTDHTNTDTNASSTSTPPPTSDTTDHDDGIPPPPPPPPLPPSYYQGTRTPRSRVRKIITTTTTRSTRESYAWKGRERTRRKERMKHANDVAAASSSRSMERRAKPRDEKRSIKFSLTDGLVKRLSLTDGLKKNESSGRHNNRVSYAQAPTSMKFGKNNRTESMDYNLHDAHATACPFSFQDKSSDDDAASNPPIFAKNAWEKEPVATLLDLWK